MHGVLVCISLSLNGRTRTTTFMFCESVIIIIKVLLETKSSYLKIE